MSLVLIWVLSNLHNLEVSKSFSPLRTSFASSRACYHDIGSLWRGIKISLTKHFSFEGVFCWRDACFLGEVGAGKRQFNFFSNFGGGGWEGWAGQFFCFFFIPAKCYCELCSINTGVAPYWFMWVLLSSNQIAILSTENSSWLFGNNHGIEIQPHSATPLAMGDETVLAQILWLQWVGVPVNK